MYIDEKKRELLERALDEMHGLIQGAPTREYTRATTLYFRAVAIVRDRPAGERRVRSDFFAVRGPRLRRGKGGPQGEMPV